MEGERGPAKAPHPSWIHHWFEWEMMNQDFAGLEFQLFLKANRLCVKLLDSLEIDMNLSTVKFWLSK